MGVYYRECYLSCLSSFLYFVCYGTVITYPSPAFPDINNGHFRFRLTPQMMSWLASFSGLFAIPGSALIVPIMDAYGRKAAFVTSTLPLAISWLLIICSRSVTPFAIGRALAGVSLGMSFTAINVYLSELSPKQIRGKLNMMAFACFDLGGFVTNLLGTFVDWQWLAVVCLGLVSATALASFAMLESPRWLVSRGYREQAAEVVTSVWKIKDSALVTKELEEIEANVRSLSTTSSFDALVQLFRPPFWKPLLLTQALIVLQMLTGFAYINNYTVTIFRDATSGSSSSSAFFRVPNYQSCIIFLGNFAGNCSSMFLIDKFGRRKLFIVTDFFVFLSLALLGAYYYVQSVHRSFASLYLSWLPLTCLLVFVFCFSSCFVVVPSLLVSEVFALKLRAVASGIGCVTHNVFFFIVVKVFPNLHGISNYGVFWIFAGCTFVSVIVVVAFVPETKGQSLEEIQKTWFRSQSTSKQNLQVQSSDL